MPQEFDAYSTDYERRLQKSIRGLANLDSAVRSKLNVLERLIADPDWGRSAVRMLDFGCGTGSLTGLLRRFSNQVFGIDVSGASLRQRAASRPPSVQFDGNRVPLRDDSIDIVVASCVYHHVPPARRSVVTAEIKRILAPGGLLVVIEHNPFNPVTRWVVGRCEFDRDAELIPIGEMGEQLRSAGLDMFRQGHFYALPPINPWIAGVDFALRKWPVGAQYFCAGRKPA